VTAKSADKVVAPANELFRRTEVARSRSALENQSRQLAFEALDMTNPEPHLYPSPSWDNCQSCVYCQPCIAMNEGF
jgi:hypothetical protein